MSIEHHGAKLRVGGSEKNLTFIAFYADCRHEVHPIKQGYRVVLTYNLIVEGSSTVAEAPAANLVRAIHRNFLRARVRRGGAAIEMVSIRTDLCICSTMSIRSRGFSGAG
jgi:hypothetical protein